ncbi:DUF1028 domain-containing protein [Flavilitoribacter nigricans]|uniref:DUF1028 domain-containing protein n=1 Tax=Flavilitoribacter nigricans (strain ATCC 23147 / DSM 23189 / NBRC 102662 / NCIMB 1420 / SS-2) TaxID=1122177 RepID=A0A2D0NCY3_FLAN2|nr:DUF1028 domain-containing protein [Flavilitoribacter nigricans]PHN06258.1 hypothetical protein CRP01_11820 [Flavilitoribacter nigricans DSM 23189 = NBRC 102662]
MIPVLLRSVLLPLLFLLSVVVYSQDTFSIVAVDPETGEVGVAGASCVDGAGSFGGVRIINRLIPGRGGVNAQAWICVNPNVNLNNAITRMQQGDAPNEIIDWLIANDACEARNFDPRFRQYGIVDLGTDGNPRAAAFTGSLADDYKGHITGLNYSIQGNILIGPEVLIQMEERFLNTSGSLAEKLMAAMQGAKIPGADARCLSRGTTSTSAFLRVARPDDPVNNISLDLNVSEVNFGKEPIDALQRICLINNSRLP